jgi:hypothetical protein
MDVYRHAFSDAGRKEVFFCNQLCIILFAFSLPGRQNFYVSPLRDEFKYPMSPSCMTPRTRHLYSFGEGPLVSYMACQSFYDKACFHQRVCRVLLSCIANMRRDNAQFVLIS